MINDARYHWTAHYHDGSVIKQIEGHNLQDLSRYRLKSIKIEDHINNKVVYTQHFKPGQSLIYRLRTAISEENSHIKERIHILGWMFNGIRHLTFIFESDGRIESGDFVEDGLPWFYSIVTTSNDHIKIE